MIKIAICDDNKFICSEIDEIILDYQKYCCVEFDVSVFYKGESLINFIKNKNDFDLIFLDIELGTTTGIDVGLRIREELDDHISKIVFITSKNGYESQLFDIQPLNFLRKPIDSQKLQKCIDLTVKLLGRENKTFKYKKNYDVVKVKIKDILYFEKEGRKIKIVTTFGEDFFNETILSIKNRLPQNFIEPHGSFIVNFEKIIRLQKDYLIMVNNKEIPVSQRSLKNIRTMLLNSEMEM